VALIDPIDSQDRERRRGALIFGASVLIAAAIVLGRLLLGGAPDPGGRQSVPPVATVVFLTPAAPTAPATEVPATPTPAAQPVATPVTAPVATVEPQAAADEGELVGRVVCIDPRPRWSRPR
jgi:hypothetical protein